MGVLAGFILGTLSYFCGLIKVLLWFPTKVIKSVPVASFVILVLLWTGMDRLSTVIAFLIVFPNIYQNMYTGLSYTDQALIDMAMVHRVSFPKQFLRIYMPTALPVLLGAASVSVGFAWKAGVAAEVIGLCRNSIGNELFNAKLYLYIPSLFAWTVIIIFLSFLCEKLLIFIMKILCKGKINGRNTL